MSRAWATSTCSRAACNGLRRSPLNCRSGGVSDVLTVLQRATQSEHGLKASARAAVLLDHLVGAHPVTLAGAMVPVMIDTSGVLASVLDRRVGELDAEALGA